MEEKMNANVNLNEGHEVKAKLANPAPLGLFGFGMTTVMLCLHFAGITGMTAAIAAMAFALGGLVQLIAGIFELKQGNTFGGMAFTTYGGFWWSLVFIWLNPTSAVPAADSVSMGFYLLMWGLFTSVMFIGTLKHNRALQVVFLSIAIVFFGLSAGDFSGIAMITKVFGFLGIFGGAAAMYTSFGHILKGEFGREILPLG